MAISIGLVALGIVLLVAGGELLLRGAVALATLAKVTPAVIGLTVVAAGTSVPELAVSMIAALKGSEAVAVGNVVGSNIFNITFILGLSALIRPLAITGNTIRLEYPVLARGDASVSRVVQRRHDRPDRRDGVLRGLRRVHGVPGLAGPQADERRGEGRAEGRGRGAYARRRPARQRLVEPRLGDGRDRAAGGGRPGHRHRGHRAGPALGAVRAGDRPDHRRGRDRAAGSRHVAGVEYSRPRRRGHRQRHRLQPVQHPRRARPRRPDPSPCRSPPRSSRATTSGCSASASSCSR